MDEYEYIRTPSQALDKRQGRYNQRFLYSSSILCLRQRPYRFENTLCQQSNFETFYTPLEHHQDAQNIQAYPECSLRLVMEIHQTPNLLEPGLLSYFVSQDLQQ